VLKVQYDGSTDLERLEDEHYPQATRNQELLEKGVSGSGKIDK
jgi:hypothetical protein